MAPRIAAMDMFCCGSGGAFLGEWKHNNNNNSQYTHRAPIGCSLFMQEVEGSNPTGGTSKQFF